MSIMKFLRKLVSVKIPTTKKLPVENLGGSELDSCKICMDIFSKGNKEPYIVYSAGIGDRINFELELLNRLRKEDIAVELYAIDPTPKSLQFLSEQNLPDNFHILPYALSNKNEDLYFALPQTEGWVSGSAVDVKQDSRNLDFENKIKVSGRTIESIMKELGHNKIDFLKMDIEGSEFNVLEETLNSSINITEMCIDHHEHMLKNGRKRIKNLLSLINKEYDIFYVENDGYHSKYFSCIHK